MVIQKYEIDPNLGWRKNGENWGKLERLVGAIASYHNMPNLTCNFIL